MMSTHRRTARGVAGLVAVIGLGASACGGSSSPTANQTIIPPIAAQSGVPDILSFTAPLVGGGEIDARTLAGKPTVLWFWAPT